MILKHTVKRNGVCYLSEHPELTGFWSKEAVTSIADFCARTEFSLDIVSSTQFRLVKE